MISSFKLQHDTEAGKSGVLRKKRGKQERERGRESGNQGGEEDASFSLGGEWWSVIHWFNK